MATTSLAELSTGMAMQIPTGATPLRGRLALPKSARGLVIIPNGDGDHLYDDTNAYVAQHLFKSGFAMTFFFGGVRTAAGCFTSIAWVAVAATCTGSTTRGTSTVAMTGSSVIDHPARDKSTG